MKVRVLGCGPSGGVPSLFFGFGHCNPNNPKNQRTRCAILIETDDHKNILIDTDPEIRTQLLKAGSPKIDAILYTHCHYDHMGGANDLAALMIYKGTKVPVYLQQSDADIFKQKLYYVFEGSFIEKPIFDVHVIEPYKPFYIGNNEIIPIKQNHGPNGNETTISIGYRIGNFAYSTDVKEMEEKGFNLLKNLDTWMLGVVTTYENNKHVHLSQALEWIDSLKPKKTFLTHMGERMDYDMLCENLPNNIRPAYDELEFIVEQTI